MNKYLLILLLVVSTNLLSMPSGAHSGKKRLKVGLVLGGGGAKGAAEVGVLKVIEKSGIPIDYIAGTSIGSIIGGLYAVGYRSAQLDSMFRSQEWITLLSDRNADNKDKPITRKNGVTYLFGFPLSNKNNSEIAHAFGAVRGDNVIELLDSMTHRMDSVDFDKLPIPFRCVASDMKHQREVVFSKGRLPIAMRASMSIPGAFKPVRIDSTNLYDGGMLNNLPVDVVREMGADVVIAIDLTQNKRKTKDFSLKETTGIGGILNWVVSRPDLIKYNTNRYNADVYINPDLEGYGAGSFNPEKISKMIEIGEKAGNKAFHSLKMLKKKIYHTEQQ